MDNSSQASYKECFEKGIPTIQNVLSFQPFFGVAIRRTLSIVFAWPHKIYNFRLDENHLVTLHLPSLATHPSIHNPPNFYISDNPLLCDCHMDYLAKMYQHTQTGILNIEKGNIFLYFVEEDHLSRIV